MQKPSFNEFCEQTPSSLPSKLISSDNYRHGGKYVSYRCGNRNQKKLCKNAEIRREYIEQFVLSELQSKLFIDAAVPQLVKKRNEYQQASAVSRQGEVQLLEKHMAEVSTEISNIVKAISQGFIQATFKDRVTELEETKAKIEARMKELEVKSTRMEITEDTLRGPFSQFRQFVVERNIPECKKFIDSYVKRVDVYKDHVEVN